MPPSGNWKCMAMPRALSFWPSEAIGLPLRKVFPRACIELGIGAEEDDEERREQLANIILAIAQGEVDLERILARAVYHMRPTGSLH